MEIRNAPDVCKNGTWIKSYNEHGIRYHTRAKCVWSAILNRTKNEQTRSSIPTYTANICDEWLDFQSFASWCQDQYGYLNKEPSGRYWCLDKDLLSGDHKIYSPETCCFIPSLFNNILKPTGRESPTMIGVSNRGGIFMAYINNINANETKRIHLGTRLDELEAHKLWQSAKVSQIKEAISLYPDIPSIVKSAMLARAVSIQNDLDNHRVTLLS